MNAALAMAGHLPEAVAPPEPVKKRKREPAPAEAVQASPPKLDALAALALRQFEGKAGGPIASARAGASKPARLPCKTAKLPDLARLERWSHGIAQLAAPGIEKVESLPLAMRVVRQIGMYELAVHTVRKKGQALGTLGVVTCYAVCARGINAQGEVVLALGHHCDENPKDVMAALERAMAAQSVEDFQVYVVGGELSTFIDTKNPGRIRGGSIEFGFGLLEAAGHRLAAARIGVCETRDDAADSYRGCIKGDPTGRPQAVNVVIDAQGVYYLPDGDGPPPF